MASLRSPFARGARAAAGSLAGGIDRIQQERAAEAAAIKAAERQLENQKALAEFQFGLNEQGRVSEFLRQLAAKENEQWQALLAGLSRAGTDPAAIPTEDYLRAVAGEMQTPRDIDQAVAMRNRLEAAARNFRTEQRGEKIQDTTETIGPGGVKGITMPDKTFIPTERDPETEGKRAATVFDAVTPGAVRRAGQVARAEGAAVPQIVGGINPITGESQFSRVNRVTGEENPLVSLAPREPGGSGGGGEVGRANAALSLFDRFEELSKEINTAQPGVGRLIHGARSAGRQITRAEEEEYGRIRDPLGLMLAVVVQGSRPTDIDARISAQLLPGFATSKPVAERLNKAIRAALNAAIATNKQRGIDLTQMSLEQIIAAAEAGQIAPTDSLANILARAGVTPTSGSSDVISAEDFLKEP